MSQHISEHPGGRRAARLVTSATAAASTFALVIPVGLITTALRGTGRAPAHRISLHGTRASSAGHHAAPTVVADLTALSVSTEFALHPVGLVSSTRPHERPAPMAAARGPPD